MRLNQGPIIEESFLNDGLALEDCQQNYLAMDAVKVTFVPLAPPAAEILERAPSELNPVAFIVSRETIWLSTPFRAAHSFPLFSGSGPLVACCLSSTVLLRAVAERRRISGIKLKR
jgi:hypothetical protein